MFKRKILKEFENWKASGGKKKALVVKGMRQIGKTSSVLEFARSHYENVVYINFKENENAKRVFDSDLNVGRITIDLSVCKRPRQHQAFYGRRPLRRHLYGILAWY